MSPLEQHLIDEIVRITREIRKLEREAERVRKKLEKVRKVRIKTHCWRGHEFTPDNVRWHSKASGVRYRECRECERQRGREDYRRKKKNPAEAGSDVVTLEAQRQPQDCLPL